MSGQSFQNEFRASLEKSIADINTHFPDLESETVKEAERELDKTHGILVWQYGPRRLA
jgi:hypothetical protein